MASAAAVRVYAGRSTMKYAPMASAAAVRVHAGRSRRSKQEKQFHWQVTHQDDNQGPSGGPPLGDIHKSPLKSPSRRHLRGWLLLLPGGTKTRKNTPQRSLGSCLAPLQTIFLLGDYIVAQHMDGCKFWAKLLGRGRAQRAQKA
eukprot:scaffold127872_cov21-Tisochrysis_lutea.AAC.2